MKLKRIADRIFKSQPKNIGGNGLFVTLEELIAERQYAYQWQVNRLHKITTMQAGDVKSAFKGRGMEFEEIRAYTFGDDVRDIDWRVTARKSTPYTKLYAEEKDREVYVLLDLSSSMFFGTKKELKAVTAAKIAARIGWQCLKSKDRFGCLINDGHKPILLKAQNSQANMMLIFKKIADVSRLSLQNKARQTEETLVKSISLLQKKIKHRAIVFIISDFYWFNEEMQKLLAQLGQKADVTCVNIIDNIEKRPPLAGEYMVQEGSQQLVFSTQSEEFCREYITYFAQKHKNIEDFCRQFKLHYITNS